MRESYANKAILRIHPLSCNELLSELSSPHSRFLLCSIFFYLVLLLTNATTIAMIDKIHHKSPLPHLLHFLVLEHSAQIFRQRKNFNTCKDFTPFNFHFAMTFSTAFNDDSGAGWWKTYTKLENVAQTEETSLTLLARNEWIKRNANAHHSPQCCHCNSFTSNLTMRRKCTDAIWAPS